MAARWASLIFAAVLLAPGPAHADPAPDPAGSASPADGTSSKAAAGSETKSDQTAPPTSGSAAAPPSSAAPAGRPPSYYYVEPPDSAPASPPEPAQSSRHTYEPPPPATPIYEPPPPPQPHHIAPKTSLWLGARLGWFIPFGDLYGACVAAANGYCEAVDGTAWSKYASSGPMFELDGGMRLGRHYNVFLLWERAELGTGGAEPDAHGGQKWGDSDFYGLGLRFSSDPDRVGFLTEIDVGYRRFHAVWNDGTELQLTNAPFEFRLGLGADIRVSRLLSLSPMVTIGAGAFGNAQWQLPNGQHQAVAGNDQATGHGWLTFQVGGHFDLAGK